MSQWRRFLTMFGLSAMLALTLIGVTGAEEAAPAAEAPAAAAAEAAAPAAPEPSSGDKALELSGSLKVGADTLWVMIAAFLVFWMNAGFALLESGLCRSKNAVNILAKNFVVFAISSIAFWAVGFAMMFGDGNPFVGLNGWFMQGADNSPAMLADYKGVFGSLNWTGVPLDAKFFFQLVFAGTAATIVSGAVAERIKFLSFIVFSFILVAVLYPIAGHWIWGAGFLAVAAEGSKAFFRDFAGSTVVHSIGGWAALAGVIVLGPRLGKFRKDGSVQPIPGHSMALATLGTFILWLGWFGFNPGSTMAVDVNGIASVALNTNMAAAAGCLAATAIAWLVLGKPDLSMILNGTLAGLVAITAPCYWVGVGSSIIIGAIAGVLVVFCVLFFDKVKLDDPVGALSVHLCNGIFGTIAVGLFASKNDVAGLFFGGGAEQLMIQLKGVLAVGLFVFPASIVSWYLIKAIMGIRVSAEEEEEGLDKGEHGMEAYPDLSLGGYSYGSSSSSSMSAAAPSSVPVAQTK